MEILKIVGWDTTYENNRTRELREMEWVPIPNKMDGDGYTELLSHENGALHYAAWMAIILIASKCKPRGTLIRESGIPHDVHSLSRISRINVQTFVQAIPRLVQIKWLSVQKFSTRNTNKLNDQIPQEGAGIPQEGAVSRARAERNGTEGNGRECTDPAPFGLGVCEDQTASMVFAEQKNLRSVREKKNRAAWKIETFDEFWSVVWWRTGKDAAQAVWDRKVRDREHAAQIILAAKRQGPGILAAAREQERSALHPRTWLSQGRWDDEESPAAGRPMHARERSTMDALQMFLGKGESQ
jgi:hypothetical protein